MAAAPGPSFAHKQGDASAATTCTLPAGGPRAHLRANLELARLGSQAVAEELVAPQPLRVPVLMRVEVQGGLFVGCWGCGMMRVGGRVGG